jgi:hypothetical protein
MEIKYDGVCSYQFPKTLLGLNELQLLGAVQANPQDWDTQRRILDTILVRDIEAEIIQRNPDYAIMRICPTGRNMLNSHWLIGYADDRGLFIHNLPEGNIDYCSEPMWYILQWINRIEDKFERVQGDLLIRDIKDGWEIERLEREEKENPHLFECYTYPHPSIGNRHEILGEVAATSSEAIEDDAPAATVKLSKGKPLTIEHRTHQRVRRATAKKEFKEVALQRRGKVPAEREGD